jgi:ADP-heptose:LPS heptosyltransferase
MVILVGQVARGFGQAARDLAAVADLICAHTGLRSVHPGTFNVRLTDPYLFESDAEITTTEFHGRERLRLKRCSVGGLRGVIVRPETHDAGNAHGSSYVEILAEVHLRDALRLNDGDPIEVAVGRGLACWEDADAAPRMAPRTKRKLILRNFQSPGDIVMLTAAVRDLHRAYPEQFETDVRTPCPALWENNPYLTSLDEHDPEVEIIKCEYPLIRRSNQEPNHFLHGFPAFLSDRLGLRITVTEFKGDVHISQQEKNWFSRVEEIKGRNTPFWLVSAGGKRDYTIKWWDPARYQQVIDHFRGRIEFVQVGDLNHHHPPLDGVIDLRGQTDLRQLVRLVYHAQGVICPVSLLMHLAAAVEVKSPVAQSRPCVVIAGGREPPQWEAYPHHQFIHTVGALKCCGRGGCWKSRTMPLGDGDEKDRPENLCVDVIGNLPRCMDMITAEEVIRRVNWHFAGGALI